MVKIMYGHLHYFNPPITKISKRRKKRKNRNDDQKSKKKQHNAVTSEI